MDPVLLSRIQFGFTAFFHFLFPPLSIGLAALIATIEFKYWRTSEPIYDKMARFWTKLFMITFVVGVATGITMEFQFGTNWSEYSKFVGDIFGAPLAAEGVFAFFMESTFIGLLYFGRDKISRRMRFVSAFLVALGSSMSAFWIIVANSWQQTPTAYKIEGGRAVLTDFFGAVFNPSTIPRFLHTVDGAMLTGAFFMMGISAYYLLKKTNVDIAKPSLKIALIFALIAALLQGYLGDEHAKQVANTQPAKLAAFEGMWETQTQAPLNLFGIPDPQGEKTHLEIGVPGLLSFLVKGDTNAPIQGLKAFSPDERPPLLATYWSYRLMVFMAGYMILLMLCGIVLHFKGTLYTNRLFLKLLFFSIPIPFLTNEMGWMAAEVGRQPWIVYGVLKTNVAASPLPAGQVLLTTIMFFVAYASLAVATIYLLRRQIMKPVVEQAKISPKGISLGQ